MKKTLLSLGGLAVAACLGYFGFSGHEISQILDGVSEIVESGSGAGSGRSDVSENGEGKSGAPAARTKKTAAGQSQERKMELPAALKGTREKIIEHTGFTLSFNSDHNNPNWVAWELTADEAECEGSRSDEFFPDPMVPESHRVTTFDYKGSGYDRGHMCPAADMRWSPDAMHDCFYLSNICPQVHALNGGGWQVLEKACRRWALQEGAVYVICGPVYGRFGGVEAVRGLAGSGKTLELNPSRKPKAIGSEHVVTVPDGFFKCVLSLKKGHEKAIAFYYSNNDKSQTMSSAAVSVDDIEALTGMDFFVNLDNSLERRLESSYSLKLWN